VTTWRVDDDSDHLQGRMQDSVTCLALMNLAYRGLSVASVNHTKILESSAGVRPNTNNGFVPAYAPSSLKKYFKISLIVHIHSAQSP